MDLEHMNTKEKAALSKSKNNSTMVYFYGEATLYVPFFSSAPLTSIALVRLSSLFLSLRDLNIFKFATLTYCTIGA